MITTCTEPRISELCFFDFRLEWGITMIYRGHVKGGLVVLDTPGVLPDGVEVRVEVVSSETEAPLLDENGQTLGEKLMKFAGRAVGLPEDAAVNHDHYLYGAPKR
jgi:hypothetical protein